MSRSHLKCVVFAATVAAMLSGCEPTPRRSGHGVSAAPQSPGTLADQPYVDPKGYFRIVPPAGWSIQEYPDDPRGKVAFHCPGRDIDLRVLVNLTEYDGFGDLVAFCRETETKLGFSTGISEIEFHGVPAVKRVFEMRGQKMYYIDFLDGQVAHNLAYGAPGSEHANYLPLIQSSMETYEVLPREVSGDAVRQSRIAKLLRLGQLMMESDKPQLALEYVNEGLALDPENPQLNSLKQEIQQRPEP